MSTRGLREDEVLSSALVRVAGRGARILTTSYTSRQCSLTRCAPSIDDVFNRFCVSYGVRLFISGSVDVSPRLGEPSEDLVLAIREDEIEVRLKFDDTKVYELWQFTLFEAVATARCQEAFTTYSASGRLSYYRLNRALLQCAGMVSSEHPCMTRGRFLLTARRQLSDLLLRFRDAGVAFTTHSEVANIVRYCKEDVLLARDSDVDLLERVLAVVPQSQSYSSTSAACKAADEQIDGLLANAALDELQDEQNGLFAYDASSPGGDDSGCGDRFTPVAADPLEEKLAAMNGGPSPVEAGMASLAAPSTPSGFSPHMPLVSATDLQIEDDAAFARAVAISFSASPLATAQAWVSTDVGGVGADADDRQKTRTSSPTSVAQSPAVQCKTTSPAASPIAAESVAATAEQTTTNTTTTRFNSRRLLAGMSVLLLLVLTLVVLVVKAPSPEKLPQRKRLGLWESPRDTVVPLPTTHRLNDVGLDKKDQTPTQNNLHNQNKIHNPTRTKKRIKSHEPPGAASVAQTAPRTPPRAAFLARVPFFKLLFSWFDFKSILQRFGIFRKNKTK